MVCARESSQVPRRLGAFAADHTFAPKKRATREVLKWALGAKLSKIVPFASVFYVSEHKIDKKTSKYKSKW
jgi:hypothetical protein